MWDSEPRLQLHLLALRKNGLHSNIYIIAFIYIILSLCNFLGFFVFIVHEHKMNTKSIYIYIYSLHNKNMYMGWVNIEN